MTPDLLTTISDALNRREHPRNLVKLERALDEAAYEALQAFDTAPNAERRDELLALRGRLVDALAVVTLWSDEAGR